MAVRRTFFARGTNPRTANLLLSDYKRVKDLTEAAARSAIQACADLVLQNTLPHVPVDTGDLYRSGVALVEVTGNGIAGIVTFGNAEGVDYAVIVHEDLEAHHDIGSAKFLEIGGLESIEQCNSIMLTALRGVQL